MNFAVVGNRDGKPQVRWTTAILLACVLGLFSSAVAAGVYFALTGIFSLPATMIGFGGAFITVGSGTTRSMKRPNREEGP